MGIPQGASSTSLAVSCRMAGRPPELAVSSGRNLDMIDSDKSEEEEEEEQRRSAEMEELGSEVFNLKLSLQEYEDRLAKLYQTEDRSKWRGPAMLLVSAPHVFFFGVASKNR